MVLLAGANPSLKLTSFSYVGDNMENMVCTLRYIVEMTADYEEPIALHSISFGREPVPPRRALPAKGLGQPGLSKGLHGTLETCCTSLHVVFPEPHVGDLFSRSDTRAFLNSYFLLSIFRITVILGFFLFFSSFSLFSLQGGPSCILFVNSQDLVLGIPFHSVLSLSVAPYIVEQAWCGL